MQINPNIFRAYDIRGIAGTDLTAKTIFMIGKATGIYLQKKYRVKKMAVGCDNRLSGEILKKSFIEGVAQSGIQVTDVGLAISPMIYWSVCAMDFDAAANITASHNPKQYNGVKIVTKNAHSICGEELQKILKLAQKLTGEKITPGGQAENKSLICLDTKNFFTAGGQAKNKQTIRQLYLGDLISRISPLKKKLKIVVDTGNGTAGIFAPEFLKKIGCKVTPLFRELDGRFPNHEANPEDEKNMKTLMAKVKKTKADLGLGFDGDGDRIGVVDEKGHMYSSDFMLLLLATDLLKRIPSAKIVFDTKTSQVIIDELKKLGAKTVMSKTGHSFIEQKMKKIHAHLAGETSGHLFFAENFYGFDDALLAAGRIVEIIAKKSIPLSEIFKNLPKTFATPELRVNCSDDKKFAVVKKLVAHFTKLYPCITIDGVRVNFDKNSWGAVRASNTSPCLTLRFEAQTEKRLQEIQKIMAIAIAESQE